MSDNSAPPPEEAALSVASSPPEAGGKDDASPPPASDTSSSPPPEESNDPSPPPPTHSPPPATPKSSPPPTQPTIKPQDNSGDEETSPSEPAVSISPPPDKPTPAAKPPPQKSSPPPPATTSSPPVNPAPGQPQKPSTPTPAGGSSSATSPPSPQGSNPSQPATLPTPSSPSNQQYAPPTRQDGGSTNSHGTNSGGSSSSSTSHQKGMNITVVPTGSGAGDGGNDNTGKVVVTAAVVGVLLILVMGVLLFAKRLRKKSPKQSPPNKLSPNHDGAVLYVPQPGLSGQYYRSPGSAAGDSFGSQAAAGNNSNFRGTPDSNVIGGSKTFFSYEELMELTNGFSRQNIIGEGGFGCVYKGTMQDGKMVAVKQLKVGSGQGDREFKAEVEIISRVHHRHLVSLVGYCISNNQRLLIYDFVPNKTLEHHLHSTGLQVLDWSKRVKIAIGSAKGLAYLHEDCKYSVLSQFVIQKLFTETLSQQTYCWMMILKRRQALVEFSTSRTTQEMVADFGLARLNDTSQSHVSTRVMGTFGYLAPEYASSGKLTDRSDVYSFGVVLLELITGRKPVDPTRPLGDESLVEWARPLLIQAIESGDLGELVDPRLEKNYVESEMLRMIETAAACVRHSAPKRPRMMQVVRVLDCDNELADLSNGVKFGQSTVYDSGQYSEEIRTFRRLALGSNTSSEYEMSSGEFAARDASNGVIMSSSYTSGESETQVMIRRKHDNYGTDQLDQLV
ncbi:hypothetical protein Tsubulata_026106 [Turnera subulata]|uniref:non-specific serine/threonine protein kinase n=1 Tax=Turnera subulata TaxID=218843 RepID=A0A9Q0G670_9ROSI|nr:hypothetical protein Tsubulata_026106 [Turnera subulata]